jgi:hypothetical protein
MLTAAAIAGMRNALALMTQSIERGEVVDRPDLLAGIEEITRLVGYSRIEALEAQFLSEDQLVRKYGTQAPGFVVPEQRTSERQ